MGVDGDSDSSFMLSDEYDSEEEDRELQRKFAAGELKDGLHVQGHKAPKREYKNNVPGLKQKLSELTLDLPWIERFDLISEPAAMAPELDAEIVEHGQRRSKNMKGKNSVFELADDPVHNDFKREMTFYRQAQAAVMEGYDRLTDLGLPTNRPQDYFAQMAKSDEHMQKVRKRLLNKQVGQEISQRVKKIREIKKYGKKVQIEVEQQKHKDKNEMLNKIKKFRKGKTDTIDFLEEKKGGPLRKGNKGSKGKRDFKDKKFGFGGQKKNSKRNNANSNSDNSSMPSMVRPGAGKGKRGMKPKGNRNKKSKSKGRR